MIIADARAFPHSQHTHTVEQTTDILAHMRCIQNKNPNFLFNQIVLTFSPNFVLNARIVGQSDWAFALGVPSILWCCAAHFIRQFIILGHRSKGRRESLVNHISCAHSHTSGFCLDVVAAHSKAVMLNDFFRTHAHSLGCKSWREKKTLTRKMIMWF